jgi:quinolinate synthase
MTPENMYKKLNDKLAHVVPDTELRRKAAIAAEIMELKQQKNAVILAHNYMEPALYYSIPDIVGDSLDLSRKAAEVEEDIILFCGVTFMAETAKLLSPEKKVLCPVELAGCSLAESITAEDIRRLKQQYPGVPVVTYVNTYADVKAETDICCTSGNAQAVMNSLDSEQVIFLPDEHLAANIAKRCGKTIIYPTLDPEAALRNPDLDVQVIGWRGACEVHERFIPGDVENIRKQYPDAKIISHPEAPQPVIDRVDFAGGTMAMARYIEQSEARQFAVLTECSMSENLSGMFPDREFIDFCRLRCPHMNLITLEATLEALQQEQYEVTVPEEIAQKARAAVQRMIEIG